MKINSFEKLEPIKTNCEAWGHVTKKIDHLIWHRAIIANFDATITGFKISTYWITEFSLLTVAWIIMNIYTVMSLLIKITT